MRERHHRRRHRHHQVPGAAVARRRRRPLHRHRQLQHHHRSRRELDQRRHLPRHDPRQEQRRLLHVAGQARPHPPRQVPGAQRADAGGHRRRRRSAAVPRRLQRDALRHLRARHRRRPARQGGQGRARQVHRPADPGQRRDGARRLRATRQAQARGAVRRMDRLLRQRHPRGAGARHQGHLSPQRSDHPGLPAAAPAGRTGALPRRHALGADPQEHRGRRAFPT